MGSHIKRRWLARRLLAYLLLVSSLTACAGQSPLGSPPQTASVQATAVSPTPQVAAAPSSTAEPPMATSTAEATVPAAAATPTDQQAATTPVADLSASAIPEGSFRNPILNEDFPDPSVLDVEGTFYAYATSVPGRNVQLARSSDLVHWEQLGDPLPVPPAWADPVAVDVWSPDVTKIGDQYVMYYAARDLQTQEPCIGVATSTQPEGPFTDRNQEALICTTTLSRGRMRIDPSIFIQDGQLYLYFGLCCDPSDVYVQRLTPDGLRRDGEATQMLTPSQPWEGDFVLAPVMWQHAGNYYLFFSGNEPFTVDFGLGYAICESPTGPCTHAPENPILQTVTTKPPVLSPGSADLVSVNGHTWMLYHANEILPSGTLGNGRVMWLDRIRWQDGKPLVEGPKTGIQPAP